MVVVYGAGGEGWRQQWWCMVVVVVGGDRVGGRKQINVYN